MYFDHDKVRISEQALDQLRTSEALKKTLSELQVDPVYFSEDPLVLGTILQKKLRSLL